jgi:hypothetical protein
MELNFEGFCHYRGQYDLFWFGPDEFESDLIGRSDISYKENFLFQFSLIKKKITLTVKIMEIFHSFSLAILDVSTSKLRIIRCVFWEIFFTFSESSQ